ncbi:MAG: succinate dehydrogenase cytochrome b subunit [Acidobacteriota bacterium]
MDLILGLYRSTLGKKVVMAVTGIILFGFVVVHMLGNLQIYQGPEKLNHYAELLRSAPALLWAARIVLLFCVLVHTLAAVQLTILNWGSRPMRYAMRHYREADYAARTMVWSGPIILAFVIYHILDLTLGTVNPGFVAHDVYHNVVASFQVVPVAIFYMLANVLLGIHLYHGLWSLFQTLGINSPAYNTWRRVVASVFAALIALGNVSIPLAVVTGLVR